MCPPAGTIPAGSSIDKSIPECIPADKLSQGAYKLAQSYLPPSIMNHSVRVFLIAQRTAQREQLEWDHPTKKSLLCVACILHDIGCANQFDGPQRFEIEGADAAAAYLRQHNASSSDIHEVWQAVALHTSPGIAERISVLARLLRQAVLVDFGSQLNKEDEVARDNAEQSFPRIGIEKILGDVVVDQALSQPQKAPAASWPGILLRAKKDSPEWDGVNKAF